MWARDQASVNVTAAVAPALAAPTRIDFLQDFVTAYGASIIGTTVVRVRGLVVANSGADGNNATIRMCGYIGDANDIVRGPNANDNAFDSNSVGKDYFLFEPFFCPDTAVFGLTGGDGTVRLIDVKAQRKLEEVSQRLVIDVSAAASVATTVNFGYDLSVLLMLP